MFKVLSFMAIVVCILCGFGLYFHPWVGTKLGFFVLAVLAGGFSFATAEEHYRKGRY